MRAAHALRSLAPIDARALSRDSMLLWMSFLPLLLGVLTRWLLPGLTETLLSEFGFDLTPYRHLVASYLFVLLAPLLVGLVIGFLLLDERDDRTLTALLVTPLSLESYLAYRIGMPLLLCTGMTAAALAISGLVTVPWPNLLPVLLLSSLEGPILALLLGSFADNKVQGFALMKAVGAVLLIPVFAWFLELPTQLWIGLIPSYWPMRAYWSAAELDPLFWSALAVGFVTHAALLAALLRRFRRILHR